MSDSHNLDEQVNQLASELRCVVCQNQAIADSHAPLAVQLKQEVRRQLSEGASPEQVKSFMVERYGEFVLYQPTLTPATAMLWVGPALILVVALGVAALVLRRRRLHPDDPIDGDDNEPAEGAAPRSLS